MGEQTRLLVVGAEPHLPRAVAQLLRAFGYDVTEAATATEALRAAAEYPPALVLLDVTSTEQDGLDVCRQIKGDRRLAGTVVLLCSDERTASAEQAAGLETLADGYIAWPMPDREFLARVDGLLRLRRAERRAQYLNRVLRAIRNVNHLIAREKDPQLLIEGACERLVETRGYLAGWIATLNAAREVTGTASSGLRDAFGPVAAAMQRGEFPPCTCEALQRNDVVLIEGPLTSCPDCPIAAHLGSHTVLAGRVEHAGVLRGLLNLYLPPATAVDEEDLALAKEVAGDLGFALHALELEAEGRRAEQALRESEERSRIIAELISDYAYSFRADPDGTMHGEWLNEAFTRVFGLTIPEIDARGGWTSMVHPDDLPLALAHAQKVMGGQADTCEFRFVTRAGEARWLRDYARPVFDEASGRVVRIHGAAQDITERRQAEALARYHSHVLANLNDAVVAADERFLITAWNQAAERVYGWQAAEVLGRPAPEVFQTEFIGLTREEVLRLQDETGHWEGEVIERCKDGRRIYVETRWSVLTDDAGRRIGYAAVNRDITERKQAEERLRASQARYRAMFEATGTATVVVDEDGTIVEANLECLPRTGYHPEELVGTPWLRYVAPESLEVMLAYHRLRREDPHAAPRSYEVRLVNKAGQVRDVILSVNMIPGNRQSIVSLLDITERKRMEQALRESEERHRAIASMVSDYGYVFRVEPDGHFHVEWVTDSLRQTFGISGSSDEPAEAWVRLLHPDDLERARAHGQRLLAGKDDRCELRLFTPTGEVRWIRNYAHPVVDEASGRVVRVFGAARDITERRRLEDSLRRRQRDLELLNRLGRRLAETLELPRIYRVAHEHIAELVDCANFGISVYDPQRRTLRAEYMLSDGQRLDVSRFPPLTLDIEPTCGRARAIATAQPEVIEDIAAAAASAAAPPLHIGHAGNDRVPLSALYIPMVVEDRVVGLLEVQSYRRAAYGEEQVNLLVPVANQVGLAIANAQLFEAAQRRARHLETLHTIIAATALAPDLTSLLESVLERSLHALGLEHGCIWGGEQVVARGLPPDCAEHMQRDHAGMALTGPVAASDWQTAPPPDAPAALTESMLHLGVRASLTVPIRAEERRVGGLSLVSPTPRVWSDEEVALAEAVGNELGQAIERQRLLARVQEQARHMQQMVDTMPEGVLLIDRSGYVRLANPTAERDLTALAGARVGDTLTHLGDRPLADLLTSPPRGGWHEVHAQGRTFEVIARPMNGGGAPEHYLLVISDVTHERERRAQLEHQERLAAVGQLAAGIAHDFNNIMAVIVLYAQMVLAAPDLPAKQRERLQTITEQAKRATVLIKQVLDFGRRAAHEPQPLDLVPFLKEQVKLLERTIPESVRILFDYRVDECVVNADPVRIQQVITNLALNARDAMPAGGHLRLGLECLRIVRQQDAPLPEMQPGPWALITVSDTGSGIAPEVVPHIFEPFFTTKGPGQGSGLGLAQVWGIVKHHEGHIDVRTRVGQGTTFLIYLPLLAVPAGVVSEAAGQAPVRGSGQPVLVVEDNAPLRRALVEMLTALNYRPLEAENGQAALAMLERDPHSVALVLSDLVMPEMSGEALFRALRARGIRVPVVMLSGHPLERELRDLHGQGLAGWLMKPPLPEQLAEVLAQALGGKP